MTAKYTDATANVGTDWSAYDPTYIDDGVRDPTTPTGGASEECYESDKSGRNVWQRWDTGNLSATPSSTTDYVRVWAWNVDQDIQDMKLWWGGSDQGSSDSNGVGTGQWIYHQWNISEDISSGKTGLGFSIQANATQGNGDTTKIYAAYIHVEYSATPGGGGIFILGIIPLFLNDGGWHNQGGMI